MPNITITPFLWFDHDAEAAIDRYLSLFDDAELISEDRMPDGALFLATIRLQGQELVLMNGGPHHQLTEAFSLSVAVDTQEEIDAITTGLIEGGGELTRCGWLNDTFGVSWQIVPRTLPRLLGAEDREAAGRAQQAMLQMQKLDIAALQAAFDGA